MLAAVVAALAVALPPSGVAVEHGDTVRLIGLSGRVARTLTGWRIVPAFGAEVGVVYLRDRVGKRWRLRAGTLEQIGALPRVQVVGGCFSTSPATKICGYPYGAGRSRIFSRGRLVRGTARTHGRWLLVDVGPNERLLAQWSGECEIPTAYIGDADELLVPVVSRVESFALGWAGPWAVVAFPPAGCGAARDSTGVFVGRRLIAPLRHGDAAALWR
jgi:hypothetical protein